MNTNYCITLHYYHNLISFVQFNKNVLLSAYITYTRINANDFPSWERHFTVSISIKRQKTRATGNSYLSTCCVARIWRISLKIFLYVYNDNTLLQQRNERATIRRRFYSMFLFFVWVSHTKLHFWKSNKVVKKWAKEFVVESRPLSANS